MTSDRIGRPNAIRESSKGPGKAVGIRIPASLHKWYKNVQYRLGKHGLRLNLSVRCAEAITQLVVESEAYCDELDQEQAAGEKIPAP